MVDRRRTIRRQSERVRRWRQIVRVKNEKSGFILKRWIVYMLLLLLFLSLIRFVSFRFNVIWFNYLLIQKGTNRKRNTERQENKGHVAFISFKTLIFSSMIRFTIHSIQFNSTNNKTPNLSSVKCQSNIWQNHNRTGNEEKKHTEENQRREKGIDCQSYTFSQILFIQKV